MYLKLALKTRVPKSVISVAENWAPRRCNVNLDHELKIHDVVTWPSIQVFIAVSYIVICKMVKSR